MCFPVTSFIFSRLNSSLFFLHTLSVIELHAEYGFWLGDVRIRWPWLATTTRRWHNCPRRVGIRQTSLCRTRSRPPERRISPPWVLEWYSPAMSSVTAWCGSGENPPGRRRLLDHRDIFLTRTRIPPFLRGRACSYAFAAFFVVGLQPRADLRVAACIRAVWSPLRLPLQVREVLGLEDDVTELAPLNCFPRSWRLLVDLLYNGGIGTYVKASTETNAQVGDKANDALRVNHKRAARQDRMAATSASPSWAVWGCTQRGQSSIPTPLTICCRCGNQWPRGEIIIKILVDRPVSNAASFTESGWAYIVHRIPAGRSRRQGAETNGQCSR